VPERNQRGALRSAARHARATRGLPLGRALQRLIGCDEDVHAGFEEALGSAFPFRSLLSEEPPKLVAITRYGDQLDGRRSSERASTHHALKPVDPSELFGPIEDMER
jgi:hypothetical protein